MKMIALGVAVAVAACAAAYAQNELKTDFTIHAKDVPMSVTALWVENGKPKVARGADAANAPKDAARVMTRQFTFAGGAMREAHLAKGTKFSPPGTHETVVFVQKGHLRITEGGVASEVFTGDSFWEIDGRPTVIEVLEDSIDIEASWPSLPAK